ncbi:MAG: HD-GYP domain-containing protein [Solirubrobacteraceae bacterium]
MRLARAGLKYDALSSVKDHEGSKSTVDPAMSRLNASRFYLATQLALLACAVMAAVLTYRPDDWQPLPLFAVLLLLSALGERMTITIGNQTLAASFIAGVLAMTLLGPAPAATMGAAAIVVDTYSRRPPWVVCFANLTSYVVCLVSGGLLAELLIGNVQVAHDRQMLVSVVGVLTVFGVFFATNLLSFAQIAVQKRVLNGTRILGQVRTLLLPMLPGQLAAAILAAILVAAYTAFGYPALLGLIVVILIFQYLAIALLRSEDRAEQLEARTVRLASMQLGMLVTLVETLALRDRMTARHAAAVARYARMLSREMGLAPAEQDQVHTAGLLHDIGKFALPDRILHADVLSDEDWALVRRHPQDGATLVGRLDGYGPVAEAILYHHERVDGGGYPAGLIGSEIPLASRILAVCNVYDTLTARDSYRSPMTPQDAIAELRRVAGRQLDADIVQTFVAMLERDGPVIFAHGDDADFEEELAFERRARALAAPEPARTH